MPCSCGLNQCVQKRGSLAVTSPQWPRHSAPALLKGASVLSCPSGESSWISTYKNNQNQEDELLAGRAPYLQEPCSSPEGLYGNLPLSPSVTWY